MAESEFFIYKGYPLVRHGKTIYYGNMTDKYVVMISIQKSHKVKDLEISDKLKVQLCLTAQNVDASKMIQKTSERSGLYEALDLAHVWLSRS